MPTFLAKRILSTIPVMFIVAVLVFMLLRLTPGGATGGDGWINFAHSPPPRSV